MTSAACVFRIARIVKDTFWASDSLKDLARTVGKEKDVGVIAGPGLVDALAAPALGRVKDGVGAIEGGRDTLDKFVFAPVWEKHGAFPCPRIPHTPAVGVCVQVRP